jgi:XRE family transcriptional regulator, regulator of sulfur utilization
MWHIALHLSIRLHGGRVKEIRHLLGERIRTLRMRRGLSQEELREKAGLHHTCIGAVERGEKNCLIAVIQKIASGLGVSINDLVTFTTL